MYKGVLTLVIVASVALSAHLPAGPDPIEWAEREEAKAEESRQVSRRQVPWYLPVVAVPQIVEVHHFVVLQAPDTRCYPTGPAIIPGRPQFPPGGRFPGQQPVTPGPPTTMGGGTDGGGLEGRMGGDTTTSQPNEPSRCVWAIVACCAPGSLNIRYTCFELLGCQGAFWDVNPCNNRVVTAAANTALKFYMTNSTRPAADAGASSLDDIATNLTF